MKKIFYLSIVLLAAWFPANIFAQPANDECSTATLISLATPTACPAASTSGFNQGATTTLTNQTNVASTSSAPYPYLSNCAININSAPRDVWYSFVATGYQTTVGVSGGTGTLTNPTVTMWSGSCAGMLGMGCATGSGGAATITVYQTIIGRTYYIQVAGRDSTQMGTFTLTAACANNCAGCVLQSYITPSPIPANGTYAPGQTVEFCYTVTNWDRGNANWLHGVTITYGSGWDPASLVVDSTPPSCTVAPGSVWAYYPAGQTSSFTGTYFGPGFYYETTAGSTSGVIDADPGNNFGDVDAGQGVCSPTFCIQLTAFPTDTPGSNLSVNFATSGDGESGSWSSLACSIDPTVSFQNVSSCTPPRMSALTAACNQNNGVDTATPIGNYGPYIFHWSNGFIDTTNGPSVITNLAPGPYTVTVTNSLHCVTTNRDTVYSDSRPHGGPDQYLSCPSVLDSVVMSGVGQGIWSALSTNPGPVSIHHPDSSNTTISGFVALGTYNFVWTIGACTDTVAVIVSSRPNAGPDVFTCVQGTATMAATGSGIWTAQAGNPAPTFITSPTNPVTTITGFTVGGTYNFIWSSATCRDTASVIVPVFTVSAVGDTSLCKYLTTTISASAGPPALGPFAYFWLDSTLVQSPHSATTVILPLQNTTPFHVKVTSISGCVLYDTVNVTLSGVAPRISIQPSNNNVCPGDTITLNSTVIVANLVTCGTVDTCPDNSLLSSVSVGSGGSTTDFESPYSGLYPRAKAQYLFTAADLNAYGLSSGAITDLSFFVTQINSTVGYDSFSVSMGCTNLTDLSAGFVNTLVEVAPPSQVFPNLGWSPHPFTHFYNWDGVSNLIVQVCYTRTSSSTNNSDFVSYTTGTANSVAYARNFGSGVNGCSLANPGTSDVRPNIRFGTCAPNILQYQWTPTTLLCDTCPVTQVVVSADTTYRLTVNDNGCINDSVVRVTINPYLAINATPDTSLCNHDTVQLNVSMINQPSSVCLQNYFVSSIPYATIAGVATTIPLGSYVDDSGFQNDDDGTAGPFNLPFSFPFYCQSYSQFWINANAWMSFADPNPNTPFGNFYNPQTFPPSAADMEPLHEIAMAVDDYEVTSPNSITYYNTGVAPNRVFVIKYNSLTALFTSGQTTGEIHLHEGTGVIDIMIQSCSYSGSDHTTGIKDSTGLGIAAPGRNNQAYTVTTSEGWRFVPQNGPSAAITSTVWSPNTSLSNPNITNPFAYPGSTTTYTADVAITINQFTNPEVCRVRDSVTVRAGSFPHTLTATPSTVCFGTNSQLAFNTPNTVTNYTWTPAIALTDPSIANPVATVYDTTRFVVLATDNNGCTVKDSITVGIFPYPHLTLGRDTSVCYTDSVRLSLAGSYTSFEWYTPGNPTPVSTAAVITALPRSSYVLRLQDAATSCYFYTDTITIDSFPHPLLHVSASGPLAFCVSGNVTLQTDQGYSNYNWSPSGGSGQAIPVSTGGSYSYTATDANNCHRFSDTAIVSVATQPSIALSPLTAICAGNAITVIATTTPPGVPVYWELNGTQIATGDTFTTTTPGTYEVFASQGCPDSLPVVLTTAQPPVVTLDTPVKQCNCDPHVVLKPTVNPQGNVGYLWSTGTTDSTYVVDSIVNELYTVTVTDANGCTATASEQVSITCFKVNAYSIPDTVYVGGAFMLTDSPQHVSPFIGYQWYPSDSLGSSTFQTTKGIASGQQPIDTFYLAAIDSLSGCRDTSSVILYVINHGGFRMPTAFTPNGDSRNQTMYPRLAVGSTVISFRIYNRWGQLVYDNPNAPGWDGNFGGNAQASDTYTYFVTVESPDPADAAKRVQKSVEGSFQLFR